LKNSEAAFKHLFHRAVTMGLACMIVGCGDPEKQKLPQGDGAWLLISGDVLAQDSTGQAQILIQKGDNLVSLTAPYKVRRPGFGGATVTLSTKCGALPVLVTANGEADPINSRAIPADTNSIPNCGLGSTLKRAGTWHALTGRDI
jgi:hypothetical protein